MEAIRALQELVVVAGRFPDRFLDLHQLAMSFSQVEKGLLVVLSSTEGKDVDDVKIEIDFGTDEAVYPLGIDVLRASEDCRLTIGGCSTDENDASTQLRLKVKFPIRGDRYSVRCFADSSAATMLQSDDVV